MTEHMALHVSPNANKGPMINAVIWLGAGLALILVLVRLFTRIRILRKVGIDDYVMVVAMVLDVVGMSIMSWAVHSGFGRPMSVLSPEQAISALKWSLNTQLPIVLALQIARISIAIFLLRIFSKRVWMRRFFYIMTTINTIAAIVALIVQYAQCRPMRRLWDREAPGECLDPAIARDLEVLSSAVTAFTDLTFALFPICVVWSLQMRLMRKLALVCLLGLCLLAMVATIVSAAEIWALSTSEDPTYDTAGMYLWVICDNHLIIAAGCMPTIQPLFRQQHSKLAENNNRSEDVKRVKRAHLQLRPQEPFYQLSSVSTTKIPEASYHYPRHLKIEPGTTE